MSRGGAVIIVPDKISARVVGLRAVTRDGVLMVVVETADVGQGDVPYNGRCGLKFFDSVDDAIHFVEGRPKLRRIDIADATVGDIRFLDHGRPWDQGLTEDYEQGQTIVELDKNGAPSAAFRKQGN